MAALLLMIALAIRFANYRLTRDILARDIDMQLWTRLAALSTQQRFATEPLLTPDLPPDGLLLPDILVESDRQPSLAMRLVIPSAVTGKRFSWFAGIWRDTGTPLETLRLPSGFAWRSHWHERTGTIWTTPEGDFRLASCRGRDDTILLVGTPLDQLRQALRDVIWFYIWTLTLAFPPLALALWLILSRMMVPLSRISRTAQRITRGDFAARIDLAEADSELITMATTINSMLDRLDAIRLAQARFNADLAHEILNPIHGILMQTDVSRQRPRTTEELGQTVEHCHSLALRIHKLSESLLSLAKAESAAAETLAELDLEPIVEEAAAQVADLAQARQVTVQVDACSAIVLGSADLLHQVFVNLLSNAIEYSPHGGIVEIATARAGDRWTVRVSDHGQGIPADRAGRVFDRFFREDESRVTATGGHGLGLAICRSIMQSHRGDVVYQPTPGGGATFHVHFAAAAPQSL